MATFREGACSAQLLPALRQIRPSPDRRQVVQRAAALGPRQPSCLCVPPEVESPSTSDKTPCWGSTTPFIHQSQEGAECCFWKQLRPSRALSHMREQGAAIAAPAWRKRGCWLCSPWLGQALWSGQEATSPTAPPASCPPQQPFSLPWPGPLPAARRKDAVRGGVQILGALSFFLFFWLTGLFPLHACALPLPFPSVSAHRITSKNPSAAANHVHQGSLWKRGWEPWCSGEPGS